MARGRNDKPVSIRLDPVQDPVGFKLAWPQISDHKAYQFPKRLDYADLSELDLSNVDLSNRSLYGANLAGSNLSGAKLDNSDLRSARMEEVLYDQETSFNGAKTDWKSEAELKDMTGAEAIIVMNNGAESLRYWADENGDPHRDHDRPAVIWADGTREWYFHGQKHRQGAPAVVMADGQTQSWIQGSKA